MDRTSEPEFTGTPDLSRRGFLRLAGGGLLALVVTPKKTLVEKVFLPDDPEMPADEFIERNLLSISELNEILRRIYMPAIIELLYSPSPLLQLLQKEGKTE